MERQQLVLGIAQQLLLSPTNAIVTRPLPSYLLPLVFPCAFVCLLLLLRASMSCRQAGDPDERKSLMKRFAAERESAKTRILAIGNQLLPQQEGAGQ